MTDLADALMAAIEQHRERINAEASPFVGRVPFHVDLDVNVTVHSVQVSVRPCPAEPPQSQASR